MEVAKCLFPIMSRLLLVAMFVVSYTGAVVADTNSANALQALLMELQTFRAEFKQIVYGNAAQELQSSSGILSVERPLKFRWQLIEPYAQLIVTSGKLLYIYDPDLEQVQIREASGALKGTPALLLVGDPAEVANLFEVILLDPSSEDTDNTTVYSLSPKQADSLFAEIRFFFSNGVPASIEIRDALGQLTRVEFFGQSLNASISGKEFEFVIPEGTDVLGHAEVPAS